MQRDVKIIQKLNEKIDNIMDFNTDKCSEMERYKEGLLTGMTDARSIFIGVIKDHCMNEDCLDECCDSCINYESM